MYDLMALTPLVWGWMFGVGILAVKYFHVVLQYLKWLPLAIIPMLAIINFGSDGYLLGSSGNKLGIIYFVCYVSIILWLAFSLPYIPLSFDFSYGIYIWHMPIINLLLFQAAESVWLALSMTVFCAAFSWYFVERPMLRRKQATLKLV